MDRLTRLAARLYPKWWRERYGDEFAALLEDARPGLGGALDVAKGAIAMRVSTGSLSRMTSAGALTGLVMGLAVSWMWTPQFVSSAIINVAGGATDRERVNQVNEYSELILNRGNLYKLIAQWDLYRTERQRFPAAEVLEKMRDDIRITARPSAGGPVSSFEVSFTYPDRIAAQKVAMSLARSFIDENIRPSRRPAGATLELRLPASLPRDPVSPNRTGLTLIGLGSGAIIGWLYAWMRRRRKPAA